MRKRVLHILGGLFVLWVCVVGGVIVALGSGNDDACNHEFCRLYIEGYYSRGHDDRVKE